MLSAGMLAAFASAIAVRRRGFPAGSPPPTLAATVSSLMTRVKTLPRFASAAAFLCLIVLHLLWPDMSPPAPDGLILAHAASSTGWTGPGLNLAEQNSKGVLESEVEAQAVELHVSCVDVIPPR